MMNPGGPAVVGRETAAVVAGLAAVGGTLAWAALSPESQIFGRTLVAPSRPDEFALTFDDGPNPA
ncbi:MAG TPA: hypothetical protein VK593_06300, partial [Edaphobacter sp.]|nr:hypothetical protein [Edaphobacter sp.]